MSNDDEPVSSNVCYNKYLQMCEQLSNLSCSLEIQKFINTFIGELTNSPYVFIIPLLSNYEEGLIQVIGDKILDNELRFSMTAENIQNAADNGFQFLITDINRDFPEVIEMVVGSKHNTLIFHIRNSKFDEQKIKFENSRDLMLIDDPNSCGEFPVSFFVCIAGEESSRKKFQTYINKTFKYAMGHLLTAVELREEKRVRYQGQRLLLVAQSLLQQIGDFAQLLKSVMAEAKDIAGAERCSLFMLDKSSGELVSMVFDGDSTKNEVRISTGQGIAGHVFQSGKLLNIRNAYLHPMFFKGIDAQTGFRTRNILCFPIIKGNEVIGVAQLCNKVNGFHFDRCDEEVATAFSIYCGIAIMHAVVHKKVQKAEARHKISQELLKYHTQVPVENVQELLTTFKDSQISVTSNFHEFNFGARELDTAATLKISLQIFINLDFMTKFHIDHDKLAVFLIHVQKGYRDIAYHNWMHAFSVTQFAYALIVNLKLLERNIMTDLEAFAFLVSCLCHDLDHRGIGNNFHTAVDSPLSSLYCTEGSINERHHLAQAIYILNEDECKILDNLETEDFKKFIDLVEKYIIATDLAIHMTLLPKLKKLNANNYKENLPLVRSLLISCCDLSDQVKKWPTQQIVAELIFEEFFAQGDLERKAGLNPSIMNDRKLARIPELQIDFLNFVTKPTFVCLAHIFPETQHLMDVILDTEKRWLEKIESV